MSGMSLYLKAFRVPKTFARYESMLVSLITRLDTGIKLSWDVYQTDVMDYREKRESELKGEQARG